MKYLFVIRHAKSSWANFGQPDIERPLNERGKADAPLMAARLKEQIKKIDLLVSSPAKRAYKTAKLFAGVFGYEKNDILVEDLLYHAPIHRFYKVIDSLPSGAQSVALFSHNPGITEFVNTLVQSRHVEDMPTCAIYGVAADIADWTAFEGADKQFLLFDYPKKSL